MSAQAPANPGAASTVPPAGAPSEACPLCGAPLASDQEWCLRCGAAARTRLAAAPGWKAPLVALAVVAALALGAIAAALVKLAGDSGPAPAPITHTITTAAAPATTPTAPLTSTAAPPASTATTPPAVTPSTPASGPPASPTGSTAAPATSTPTASGAPKPKNGAAPR